MRRKPDKREPLATQSEIGLDLAVAIAEFIDWYCSEPRLSLMVGFVRQVAVIPRNRRLAICGLRKKIHLSVIPTTRQVSALVPGAIQYSAHGRLGGRASFLR
jgi:hypothetical protein